VLDYLSNIITFISGVAAVICAENLDLEQKKYIKKIKLKGWFLLFICLVGLFISFKITDQNSSKQSDLQDSILLLQEKNNELIELNNSLETKLNTVNVKLSKTVYTITLEPGKQWISQKKIRNGAKFIITNIFGHRLLVSYGDTVPELYVNEMILVHTSHKAQYLTITNKSSKKYFEGNLIVEEQYSSIFGDEKHKN